MNDVEAISNPGSRRTSADHQELPLPQNMDVIGEVMDSVRGGEEVDGGTRKSTSKWDNDTDSFVQEWEEDEEILYVFSG